MFKTLINYQPQPVSSPNFWTINRLYFCFVRLHNLPTPPSPGTLRTKPVSIQGEVALPPPVLLHTLLNLRSIAHRQRPSPDHGKQRRAGREKPCGKRGGHGFHFIYTVVKPKTLENLPTISKILVWVCYQRSTFLPHTTGTHNSTAPCKHLSFTTKFDRIPSCVHVVWKWKVSRGVKLILDFFYICVFLLFFHALRVATCPSRFPHVFTMQPQSWRWM